MKFVVCFCGCWNSDYGEYWMSCFFDFLVILYFFIVCDDEVNVFCVIYWIFVVKFDDCLRFEVLGDGDFFVYVFGCRIFLSFIEDNCFDFYFFESVDVVLIMFSSDYVWIVYYKYVIYF